ncbi:hypothetical protein HanPSC8_Chr11g0454771 [Helianthus annuus]|nr:hypothetical protein HanPSC8_Chr11g0454771 [Helianthus annuus]
MPWEPCTSNSSSVSISQFPPLPAVDLPDIQQERSRSHTTTTPNIFPYNSSQTISPTPSSQSPPSISTSTSTSHTPTRTLSLTPSCSNSLAPFPSPPRSHPILSPLLTRSLSARGTQPLLSCTCPYHINGFVTPCDRR